MTQPLPLRDQLKALEHLQELDLKIDQLKKKKAALPVAMKALEDSFQRSQKAVDTKGGGIAELEKLKRQTQAALELNNDRLTRANGKLENVHNSQEFQAANKEIEQLKKMNLSLEEQVKKSDAEILGHQTALGSLKDGFEKVRGDRDAQLAVVNQEVGQLDKEIGAMTTERTQYVSKVERSILGVYDRVRAVKAGIGLVPAVGGRCSGCNMMLPPQQYNEVQRANNVQACPSCHRILFIPVAQSSG